MAFLKNISPSTATDEELVSAYKRSGNKDLLAALYQRYMELVFGVCMKYLKDQEEAKDATMNIFEELLGKLMKYDVLHFKPWLYTVAKTHCLMHLRSSSKMKTSIIDPGLMQSEEETHLNGVFEQEAALEQLSKCMQGLASDQQQAIDLFYLQKKSYKEISEETGMEWSRVRSLIQNGRRNLKICMDQQAKEKDSNE